MDTCTHSTGEAPLTEVHGAQADVNNSAAKLRRELGVWQCSGEYSHHRSSITYRRSNFLPSNSIGLARYFWAKYRTVGPMLRTNAKPASGVSVIIMPMLRAMFTGFMNHSAPPARLLRASANHASTCAKRTQRHTERERKRAGGALDGGPMFELQRHLTASHRSAICHSAITSMFSRSFKVCPSVRPRVCVFSLYM